MLDVFTGDAWSETALLDALKKIPYKPSRLGPGGMALFDERGIDTTTIGVERKDGVLTLIADTPRGAPGDFLGDSKAMMVDFRARHLRRNAKIFADEVQNVRVFGTEDERLSIEMKRDEKLAELQASHEVTWEFHRIGALVGKVLDADGSTVLLDLAAKFGVTQPTQDFALTNAALDVRKVAETVADKIDDAVGATSYDRIHVFAGANFYDDLIAHAYVKDILNNAGGAAALQRLSDMRGGFNIGPLTIERARRWRVKNPNGTMVDFINPDQAYAFPVGATIGGKPMFIGRFAPQPFGSTVNRMNPPLVVKTVVDPADQYINLIGISCPLYLNTLPEAVVKLTKS